MSPGFVWENQANDWESVCHVISNGIEHLPASDLTEELVQEFRNPIQLAAIKISTTTP
jgi:hypothetical protein